ncbi:MAG: BatD family protein [Candidatus Cloacimonetes bacterium]|nr:BatD family protein [Candidatus Cloacimonadota bacterium]
MKKRYLFACFILITALQLLSEVSVTAFVNTDKVAQGSTIVYTIEIKGEGIGKISTPRLPQMPFTITGPQQSSSTSMRAVNGKITTEKSEQFVYRLRADTVGPYRIPAIPITVGNQRYNTPPISVNVLASDQIAQQNQQQNQQQRQQQSQQQQITQDGSETFISVEVDKRAVYRNEMIVVHFKLYTQSQVRNISFAGEPSFTGFWKEELYQADRVNWVRENYQGRLYNTFVLRSIALFPQKEGTLTIPTLDLNTEILVPAKSFWDLNTARTLKISSKPINIQVNALPPIDQGKNYIGAVGKFDITSNISANEGDVGNSLTYRIILSGTGNFNQTLTPELPTVHGLRILPAEKNDEPSQSKNAFTGKRTFTYPILLQETGNITIPEMEISWFDPSVKKYVSKKLNPQSINVARSEQQVYTSNTAQKDIIPIGKDIEFSEAKLNMSSFRFYHESYIFWLVFFLLLLSLLAHHFIILEKNKLDTDQLYSRNRRASKVIRKYLKEASYYAKQDSLEFYSAAHTGLSHFITDKLNLPRGSLEKVIVEALKEREIPDTLILDLQKSLEKINFIKFSRVNNSSADIKEDELMITQLIMDLMSELKKNPKKEARDNIKGWRSNRI